MIKLTRELTEQQLTTLTPKEREAILLFACGHKAPAIGRIIGISTSQAYARLASARERAGVR